MSKSHFFSIYLLKKGYNASNSLREGHRLEAEADVLKLPTGATLYILDNTPKNPWWKDFFGISKDLYQVLKGALIFLPVGERCFALTFGYVYHYLIDDSYEYDFGLKVTLNSIDPQKIKSTDVVEPSASRRQRTQIPVASDLTYFDFDRESTIIKSITGIVKDEYKDLFKHATGSSCLRISSTAAPDGLESICERSLQLYESDLYKEVFPDIHNIEPVRDSAIIKQLNEKLLLAFISKEDHLNLAVPDIINYHDNVCSTFSGVGSGLLYEDVTMKNYYDYLKEKGVDLNDFKIDALKKHKLILADEDGLAKERYNIFKCLVFDVSLDNDKQIYHLCEGNWYRFEQIYITRIKKFLDNCFEDADLIAYNHGTEGAYNQAIQEADNRYICLDKKNISPPAQTQIEPCDLYLASDDKAIFYHVKISTRSAQISHLFNQGVNAIELIKSELQALERLKDLISSFCQGKNEQVYLSPIDGGEYKVVYVIITHKDKANRSANLPLFSRISLMRSIKSLRLMNVKATCSFVDDQSFKRPGRKKKRKIKKSKAKES